MNKIGIIGAMDSEVETLKSKLQHRNIIKKAGMEFFEGTLGNASVVVVRCGIGKVNAALCAQILVDSCQVTHIINTGVAGSLNADLNIGDIVISQDVLHHDMDCTALGFRPGEVPLINTLEFTADRRMRELAKQSCEKVCPDIRSIYGRVLSGDQFISEKSVKERLIADFKGDCAEMEGASIAHCAYLNQIPFVIIRAISDKADGSAEMDFPQFQQIAAEHSARLVEDLVQCI